MGLHDIAFLPMQANFHTTFCKIAVEAKASRPSTCLRTVGVGEQMHAVCDNVAP